MSSEYDFCEFIESNPGVLRGKPCVKGTRVPVWVVLDGLSAGAGYDEVMSDYRITREALLACLAYGARLADEEIIPINYLVKAE